ncbi:Putative methyltransferase [Blumeria hordei DH14]|uniref:Putative methyltransferase n=1 Tax=Blumeria graminis f. sp. hordei (strain DH14) TaxID=546991 RepID=N1J7N6_BLUG1|nr:Putative methyltransferase [Blumeria hordei DH14]
MNGHNETNGISPSATEPIRPQESAIYSVESSRSLERFVRQYLQLYARIDYPDGHELKPDFVQQWLFTHLFSRECNRKHPVRYKLRVLKELMNRIESCIDDWNIEGLSDNLMDVLGELYSSDMATYLNSSFERSDVMYTLSNLRADYLNSDPPHYCTNLFNPPLLFRTPTITICEPNTILATDGSTGVRTWEAALHMGDYLCSHPEIIKDKRVLELGSGTAYLSILCARYLGASFTFATDGCPVAISTHLGNFRINHLHPGRIRSQQLLWEEYPGDRNLFPELQRGETIDVILGADIIYEIQGIIALIMMLSVLLGHFPKAKVIISVAVRSPNTFAAFLCRCQQRGWRFRVIEWIVPQAQDQHGPFFHAMAPMLIISLCTEPRLRLLA